MFFIGTVLRASSDGGRKKKKRTKQHLKAKCSRRQGQKLDGKERGTKRRNVREGGKGGRKSWEGVGSDPRE